MVKIGNRIVQSRGREICQHALELAERLRCLESLPGGLDRVIGSGAVDKEIGAPVIAVGIVVQNAAQPRGNQPQHAPAAVGMIRNLRRQVRGDALDILHQRDGVLEDVVVDALQYIT